MKVIASVLVVAVCAGGALCAKIGDTDLDDDTWWGPPCSKGIEDNTISTFQPSFSDEMIEDLRYRLINHRLFRAPLRDANSSYGFNSDHIHEWIRYWAEEYPFAERAQYINKYPHYLISVQGLKIHYVKVTPEVPEGVELVPMLMLHGFPGSFLEFYGAIPHLTAVNPERNFALELIIPSLPGFGYSDATSTMGLGYTEMGVLFRNFMRKLGYNRFYIQGGDWGEFIATTIATLYPNVVLGHHTNYARSFHPNTLTSWYLGSNYPDLVVDPSVADRMYPISKILKFFAQEFGYFHIQAAKPDTIGMALTDTPAGLLAYIFQVSSMFTRARYTYSEDGGLLNHFTREQLIDNLMVYWSTNTITTACRIYAESANLRTYNLGIESIPSTPLTWAIQSKDELIYQSPYLLKFKFPNLVNTTILHTGGHFLAWEMPEIFSESVLTSVTVFRRIHKEKNNKI